MLYFAFDGTVLLELPGKECVMKTSALALFGGRAVVRRRRDDLFEWPIITAEDEQAVLAVLRRPSYADSETVASFEREFRNWCGSTYALSESSGTHAVLGAMFACGVGVGDEVIAPSSTYWATVLQCFALGATMIFADIDPTTLCIDPEDVEHRITERTRAVVVVHQLGHPAEMEAFKRLRDRYGVAIIEDASHAHGTLYHGCKVGTLGDIAAFSLCGKPISVGEGGIITTSDERLLERAIAWGHNFRFHSGNVHDSSLLRFAGLPLGGVTSRMHNVSAAIGRVQLRHYDERMAEIDRAMNEFWDLLDGLPGLHAHRPAPGSGSTMGGWYTPHAIYRGEELSGLSAARFVQAIRAEGFHSWSRLCIREPLHLHPLVNYADVYGHGRPTRLANVKRDVRQGTGSLPVTESIRAFTIPPFRRYDRTAIEEYAALFRKVVAHHEELLEGDLGDESVLVDERGNG